ncbi:MAG: hypothetical protein NT070_02680 [Cyanobacteria bacterium]|nr:hypothetical protein [Cyanobacteriota bacterium]
MSKQSWLPLVVAILPTPIGYLINQLPGIPDFPHKEWLIGSVVALLTAIGAATRTIADGTADRNSGVWAADAVD